MPRLVCYSNRGLAKVGAHLRRAIRIVENLPKHTVKRKKKKNEKKPASTAPTTTKTKAVKKTTTAKWTVKAGCGRPHKK